MTTPVLPRILIIDDIPANIEILLGMLEDDYDLSFATSGRQALALLEKRTKPDLILLDVMMPEMDGYAVCAALKSDVATRDIPIIFVTARTDADSETQALAAGAVDFIHKPVNKAVVRARIQVHLEMERRAAALQQSLAEIQQAHHRLQVLSTAIDQSPISIVIAGPDATIQYVNPHFTQETGLTSAEALGQSLWMLTSDLIDPVTIKGIKSRIARGESWGGELIHRRQSGKLYWVEAHLAPIIDADGQTTHYVAAQLDITERKQAHEQLVYLAHHDTLTHLPNRALFCEHFAKCLTMAKRNKTRMALMFIDLDRFKPINDAWGHAMGDRVLQEAAQRMSDSIRKSDIVGRIGGDEFVVLLPDVADVESAIGVAEKIRMALNQPFVIDNQTLSISSSIGLALYPDHGDNIIQLAKNADCA
ncbi:MAG: diguanylate cyclase, partial [Pseudomonadota bacterium]|nr:diguanylate cyclase [Pseudomonadota bacterium]